MIPPLQDPAAVQFMYTLIYNATFDCTSSVMQANWVAYNNVTHGPTEKQLYLAKNVRVENGNLVIQTIKDAVHDSDGILYNFSSGWVRQSVVNTQYTWGKQVYTFKIDRSESYKRCGRRIASCHADTIMPLVSHPLYISISTVADVDVKLLNLTARSPTLVPAGRVSTPAIPSIRKV